MFLYFLMFLLLFANVVEIPEKILIHQIVAILPKIFLRFTTARIFSIMLRVYFFTKCRMLTAGVNQTMSAPKKSASSGNLDNLHVNLNQCRIY